MFYGVRDRLEFLKDLKADETNFGREEEQVDLGCYVLFFVGCFGKVE